MEMNTQNDIETDTDSSPQLTTPQFNEAMVSQAQQVEPLDSSGQRRWPGAARNFFRGRLGLLAVVLIALLLGAATLGMLLGLRDRQNTIAEPAQANQATPEPADAGLAAPPVKDPPARVLTRSQRAEINESEPKPAIAPERVRRTLRVSFDQLDQALSQKEQRPRKVAEIGGRSERRGRKGESKDRKRDKDDQK